MWASDGADVNVRDGVGIREGYFEVIEYSNAQWSLGFDMLQLQ